MTTIPFLPDLPEPAGVPIAVLPGVRRLPCGNPGPFTGSGTNTWLVGRGATIAVIDPGPADPAHLAAILAAAGTARIGAILVSHTHADHSPGAAALAAATGAPTLGFGPHATPPGAGGEGADHGFVPDRPLADGEAVEGPDWRLAALHTPGHCANHLCFALEGTGALFSADLVMAWSTTVVSPPDGAMAAYMASLARLSARDDALLLPGHGPPLPEPGPFLAALAAHRRAREAAVLAALRAAGRADAAGLVPAVYGPIAPRLAPAAGRSLLAHLIKLEAEGLVGRDGGSWRPA